MTSRALPLALRVVLLVALVAAPNASPQMPARPGKLHLTSNPTGQRIIINKQLRSEVTESTLIVSPGKYTVQIGNCQEQSVSVASGVTLELHCP